MSMSMSSASTTSYGMLVTGPPGAGKSTYCNGMQQFLQALGRDVAVVNLDPANDNLSYDCAVDISELITLNDVMEHLKLGPNGGLMYCMEFLEKNFDWLLEKLKPYREHYLLFDLPGQVELFTHHSSLKNIIMALSRSQLQLCCVHLVDSHHCSDLHKFLSVLMLSLCTMLHLELPHVNVLSKMDLIESYGPLAFSLEFYSEVQDLDYLLDRMESEDDEIIEINAEESGDTEDRKNEENAQEVESKGDDRNSSKQKVTISERNKGEKSDDDDDEEVVNHSVMLKNDQKTTDVRPRVTLSTKDDHQRQAANDVLSLPSPSLSSSSSPSSSSSSSLESPLVTWKNKFRKLNRAVAEMVQDFGIVSFIPLSIQDKECMATVLKAVDNANGYAFSGMDSIRAAKKKHSSREALVSSSSSSSSSSLPKSVNNDANDIKMKNCMSLFSSAMPADEFAYFRTVAVQEKYMADPESVSSLNQSSSSSSSEVSKTLHTSTQSHSKPL